ncbi:MAG: DUF2130 domain-containing protein, partial [Muribaculaceae bacterium]|nr:DUF2130 domain-containing protein [Muribaculaceae bacterium]
MFTVDEDAFRSIAAQVRNAAFDDELAKRERELRERLQAQQLAERARAEQAMGVAMAERDRRIEALLAEQAQADDRRRIAVLEEQNRMRDALTGKDAEIAELRNRAANERNEAMLREAAMKEQHALELRQKQEMIDYYKEMKARMSTKMIGESLEAHCSNEFNRIRATAYPNAYFEKDNDASGGSKGDFIFRDYIDGTEYVSIMFEMKNEADTTATKHRNEDFLAKLDRDRTAKGCEYAVLVSLLEADNELYNEGIVDVSYRYPRMFVVRPQFFMPIIALLSQASRKSADYIRQ